MKLEFNVQWNITIFHCEGINPAAREGFIPSNKNEVSQGARSSQAAVLDFP